ncbi:MAG: hypothetical protein KFF73_12250 [Cyclobacteriaceae bacterium]|nr:hypothetical protein [Cyclobacteriaceae bacterium]
MLKEKLSGIAGVEAVSICSGNPISDNMIARYDLEDGTYYAPYMFYGDVDNLETLGFELIGGTEPGVASIHGRLVNEAFLRHFNIENEAAIGLKIPGTEEDQITGIVSDFNVGSLKINIPPAIIARSL